MFSIGDRVIWNGHAARVDKRAMNGIKLWYITILDTDKEYQFAVHEEYLTLA